MSQRGSEIGRGKEQVEAFWTYGTFWKAQLIQLRAESSILFEHIGQIDEPFVFNGIATQIDCIEPVRRNRRVGRFRIKTGLETIEKVRSQIGLY